MLQWPKADEVIGAAQKWASALVHSRKEVIAIGYFGSYARGDWGVGSDLDLVIVIEQTDAPFHERARQFENPRLPVSAELLVYTAQEWEKLLEQPTRFSTMLKKEVRWLFQRDAAQPIQN